MIVYLDLIFLMNWVIDGALLLAAGWTRRQKIRVWRVALAAAIGASYTLLMLVPQLSVLFSFGAKLLFSAAMLLTAFGFGGKLSFLRNLAAFYLINFALAGGVFGLHYFFMPSGEVFNGIWVTRTRGLFFEFQAGFWFVLAALAFSLIYYLRVFRSNKQTEAVARLIADVTIQIEAVRLECKGLVDTGNQLYDPLTKTPVMIVEAKLWKDTLPAEWMSKIQTSDVDQIVTAMGTSDFIWQDRLRIVPYRGVNRGTQFMLAIKPDAVSVLYQNKQLESHKVLIGFDGGTLSSDGTYQAIIHPMLLETQL